MNHSILAMGVFDGANCHGIDFSSSLLRKASFGTVKAKNNTSKCADLIAAKWDNQTRFEQVVFNNFLREQNKELYEHIETLRTGRSAGSDIFDSIETKPGVLGFSVDLKKLGAGLKRWFVQKNAKG